MNNHDNCGGKGATQTMRPWGVTVQLYFHVWVACSLSFFLKDLYLKVKKLNVLKVV